jgi:hypothetical protein
MSASMRGPSRVRRTFAERFEAHIACRARAVRSRRAALKTRPARSQVKGCSVFDQPPIERARAKGHVAGAVANHGDPLGLFVIGVDKSASLKRATGARAARRPWRTRVPAPIGRKAQTRQSTLPCCNRYGSATSAVPSDDHGAVFLGLGCTAPSGGRRGRSHHLNAAGNHSTQLETVFNSAAAAERPQLASLPWQVRAVSSFWHVFKLPVRSRAAALPQNSLKSSG